MKKIINTSLFTVLTVILLSVFAFNTEVEARVVLRQIDQTECHVQDTGALAGYSNNCVQGEGDCQDNGCPKGAVEVIIPQ